MLAQLTISLRGGSAFWTGLGADFDGDIAGLIPSRLGSSLKKHMITQAGMTGPYKSQLTFGSTVYSQEFVALAPVPSGRHSPIW